MTALTVLFVLPIVYDVLLGLISVNEGVGAVDFDVEDEEVDASTAVAFLGIMCMGVVYLIAYITAVVLYCIWIHRANRNARALGTQGMRFTPGWCVGWWFIPFMNLYKPYQAVSEID